MDHRGNTIAETGWQERAGDVSPLDHPGEAVTFDDATRFRTRLHAPAHRPMPLA
jgi:hypothetical protein